MVIWRAREWKTGFEVRASEVAVATASALVELRLTVQYFLELQEIGLSPKRIRKPEVERLSRCDLAQSASENMRSSPRGEDEKNSPISIVDFRCCWLGIVAAGATRPTGGCLCGLFVCHKDGSEERKKIMRSPGNLL